MKRRPASLAVIAALVAVVGLNTAARPLPKTKELRPTVPAKVEKKATPAKSSAVPVAEETISIDWRVLAGLDYTNGKATDSLKKLEGKLVRIPGFVVPLDDFQEDGSEFLLVPYYGACVHTPPPPPNQIVMVGMEGRKSIKLSLFDAVWMSGRLKIQSVESPYGTVGYTLEGMKVEPYTSK
ncbi:MAG: DUF3299 domain-containing protein [Gemmatimonadaceae bacterium]